MVFIKSAVKPDKHFDQAYYICFLNEEILLKNNGRSGVFPCWSVREAEEFDFENTCSIGLLNGKPCYSVAQVNKIVSEEYQWISLRDFYLNGERELAALAGYAKQISDWNINFLFCGRCSSETKVLAYEHARQCKKCKLINYPRISPAIIVAVIKDDKILLARGRNFSDKEMFSVLAGFVEVGESLEEAVKREIREEVGLEVINVKYFKSQPWPFPDSLMIGFTAEYKGGNIVIDKKEIVEAEWFTADALPKVPVRRSLASELIQRFVEFDLHC